MTNNPGEGRQIVASIVTMFAVISRGQGTWHVSSKPTEQVGSQSHGRSNRRCRVAKSRKKMFIFLGNFSFVDPGSSVGSCPLTHTTLGRPHSVSYETCFQVIVTTVEKGRWQRVFLVQLSQCPQFMRNLWNISVWRDGSAARISCFSVRRTQDLQIGSQDPHGPAHWYQWLQLQSPEHLLWPLWVSAHTCAYSLTQTQADRHPHVTRINKINL